ncbi:MAG: glycosyl hydrolase [Planctomycetota bacterium]|nr:MAG: glycosyl hydrolase [Planctomycetota bacterium]
MRTRSVRAGLAALAGVCAAALVLPAHAQDNPFSSLRARGIGPALTSGRITDVAVNPADTSEWWVASASGGVWKTTNAGVTFDPVFDGEGSYSIGCLAIDPSNPNVVWVGTGENNSQRSVGFGDGVYKTVDGGRSWTNLGLRDSQHIGMIAIDPRDPDTVYVAAQGPLWNAGGDRGLYKTTNGGQTWTRVLHISDHTGVSEVHMDPRDPDTLYAVAYQRRRRVWTLINGGPESAVYKSTDAGATWKKITRGLPGVDLGRIGLDVSPANPDVLYAIVEAADGKDGFFRSTNRGETWERRSGYITSSPQYYNEIFCDPHDVDRVYAADTFMHVTDDGGATFDRVPMGDRHVDDHALWIDPADTDHLIVGCDGGLYESFDRAATWRHFTNIPVTQFYKAAVDFSEPFYYVYGGTQDNNTLGGPSRTIDRVGIASEHWFVTVGGDGFQPAVDPEDPNIVYSEWQYAGLVRHDRRSGEVVDIKPRQRPGDPPYVFNWDSPLIISPHKHTRLYFGGRRVFRSEDRGNSWEVISGDLTRGIDRDTLEVMGEIQSVDAVAKHNSTSIFGNLTAIAESPLVEGLLYAGTDDGLIHVSENGGGDWRRIEAFPTVPDMTYVSYLFADRHDADTVYAAFDNHKNGDFSPYLLKSTDRGVTWRSVAGDLPERNTVYAVDQDTERPGLLFVGTEFGAYYTNDGGAHWHKIAGLPTIAVRDVKVHTREHDLVMATFGRGFYILDDYTPLRRTGEELDADAVVYPIRPARAYIEASRLGMPSGRGFAGSSYYSAPNPPFGALITYRLKEGVMSRKEARQEREKNSGVTLETYPTDDDMRAEMTEPDHGVILTIRDDAGEVVRRLEGPHGEGVHRVAWDLRYPPDTPIALRRGPDSPWSNPDRGPLALPGTYTVTVSAMKDGEIRELSEPVEFEVVPLNLATFAAKDREAVLAFQRKVGRLQRAAWGAMRAVGEAQSRLDHLERAILETPGANVDLLPRWKTLNDRLREIRFAFTGDSVLAALDEPTDASIVERVGAIVGDQWWVTSPPTQTHRRQYDAAAAEFKTVLDDLRDLVEDDLADLERDLEEAGAPWTPGRLPVWKPE